MLILRRKSGESIVIGDNITLTVLDINEGSVRLAIDAPKAITILRSELLQAADANRDSADAAQTPPKGLLQLLEGQRNLGEGVRRRLGRRAFAPPTKPDASAPLAVPDAPVSENPDASAPRAN